MFGGNTHTDSVEFTGAKCFSSDFLAYDTSESVLLLTCMFLATTDNLPWLAGFMGPLRLTSYLAEHHFKWN